MMTENFTVHVFFLSCWWLVRRIVMESLLRELVLSPRLTSSDTRRPTTQTRVNKGEEVDLIIITS